MKETGYITRKQLHFATQCPTSTLWLMERDGYLVPAVPARSRGQEALFYASAIQQVLRAVKVRQLMGDGEMARSILRGLAVEPTEQTFEYQDEEMSFRLSLA